MVPSLDIRDGLSALGGESKVLSNARLASRTNRGWRENCLEVLKSEALNLIAPVYSVLLIC